MLTTGACRILTAVAADRFLTSGPLSHLTTYFGRGGILCSLAFEAKLGVVSGSLDVDDEALYQRKRDSLALSSFAEDQDGFACFLVCTLAAKDLFHLPCESKHVCMTLLVQEESRDLQSSQRCVVRHVQRGKFISYSGEAD